MKYFKASICSLATLASFSYINSAENRDAQLWDDLKAKLKVSRNALGPKIESDEERRRLIDAGFQQIEAHEGIKIPETLKELHRNAGTLLFRGTFVLSPIGGVSSPLHNLMIEGQRKISKEWITFAQIDSNEYFGIHCVSGEVAWFTVIPVVKQYETFSNIPTWLRERFLKG